jgi:hypothetical protein
MLSNEPNPIAIDGKIVSDPEEIKSSLSDGIRWSIENRIPLWKELMML